MDKKEDIWEFEKLEQQLHSFLDEISELSKKKPNDPLNKFKLKFVNGSLSRLNTLLKDSRPFDEFETFDVDELPSNSDVIVILSQYAAAVHRFRAYHTQKKKNDYSGTWLWIVGGKISNFETKSPDDFKYKPK